MDSTPVGLGEAGALPDPRAADEDRRVEELLRVNQRLAAEVRSLALGRTAQPRSTQTPAARRLGALLDEREALTLRLEETEAALGSMTANRDELERHRAELAAELAGLRSGWRGLARRARARLLART